MQKVLADVSPPLLAWLSVGLRMHPWLSCASLSPRLLVLVSCFGGFTGSWAPG